LGGVPKCGGLPSSEGISMKTSPHSPAFEEWHSPNMRQQQNNGASRKLFLLVDPRPQQVR
jgi:hypothetical protein